MESEAGRGAIVDTSEPFLVDAPPPPTVAPKRGAKPSKGKKNAPKVQKQDDEPDFSDMALSDEEVEIFCMALVDLSEMIDSGLWHLGLDTVEDIPTKEGLPGVPIWTMTPKEAKRVADSFMVLGKYRPEVFKAVRVLNQAHAHLQAGLIVGSRFVETGIRFFETGVNFRLSKTAWKKSVNDMNRTQAGGTGNG